MPQRVEPGQGHRRDQEDDGRAGGLTAPRQTSGRRPQLAALAWGAAEASLFFIVPDLLIGWLALRRGARTALLAAFCAALGAALGGLAIFVWAARAPQQALAAVEAVPAISRPMIDAARTDVERRGWLLAALAGPRTSTPYKVYAALAPTAGARLVPFAAAALPIRLPRFLLAAAVFSAVGALLRSRLSPRTLVVLYGAGWSLFYLWFFLAHPG